MRRLAIRFAFAAIAALALASQFHGAAQACIKFDRPAEIAMLDKAIASQDTSKDTKRALRSARAKLDKLRGKTDSAGVSEYGSVIWKALALIGEKRVVWHAPEKLDVGVFRTKSLPPLAQSANPPVAMPACG